LTGFQGNIFLKDWNVDINEVFDLFVNLNIGEKSQDYLKELSVSVKSIAIQSLK
jgi:hypothetical protein